MYQSLARSCVPRTRRTLALALSLGLALVASGQASAAAKKGHEGSGCDPARPAVAHYTGGVVAPGRRANAPIPCEAFVGTTSEAGSVGVSRSGSLFYAPLLQNTSPPPTNTLQGPEFVVRSRDLGASWTPLNTQSPATAGLVPPWMSIDPATSRIWFVRTLPQLCGARIDWSDDDGDTWHTNPSVPCPSQGGEKLLEGPAPPGGATPAGYPHVVYYCANNIDIAPSNLWCYRSLDGGPTFSFVGGFPIPPCRRAATSGIRRGRAWWGTTAGSTSRPLCAALWVSRSVTTRAPPGGSGRSSARGWRTSTHPAAPSIATATSTSHSGAPARSRTSRSPPITAKAGGLRSWSPLPACRRCGAWR